MNESSESWSAGRRSAGVTHIGLVRGQNQDAILADEEKGLWLVADGLGGHAGGAQASSLARDTIARRVAEGASLDAAVQAAHQAIRRAQSETPGLEDMGTTVVALRERREGWEIRWVGDSRAYRFDPASKRLERLTRDHNLAGMLAESGAMDPEQARQHPQKHVLTECLGLAGRDQVRCDSQTGRWNANELILLCSDGLSGELRDECLGALMDQSGQADLQAMAQALMEKALEAGGHDNVSLVLIRSPSSGASSGSGPLRRLWNRVGSGWR